MISFENLLVCRRIHLDANGVKVEGVGFAHPSNCRLLIVYGHALVSEGLHGDMSYRLSIIRFRDGSMDVVHEDRFRLKVGSTEPVSVAAWIPVQSKLEPGYYDAVLEFPGGVSARAEFRIV